MKNKEILDMELQAILEVVVIANKMANLQASITIFLDFQKAIKAIIFSFTFKKIWILKSQMY